MEIVKVFDNTWSIEDGNVRFFLLSGDEKALLIDSGMTVKNAKEIAESLVDLPVELLNTHADPDHIASNHEFDRFYMNPAEASNYYNSQKRTGEIVPAENGDIIDLGGRELEIITLPGHTPGSIAVLDKNNRALFSGDPIQDGSIFMFGIQREMHAYILSLEKLKKYTDRFDKIYPSHGTCPVDTQLIDDLREGAECVLAGDLVADESEFFGQKIKVYDVGAAKFLCD